MLDITELGARMCRYPLTARSPHFFCGDQTTLKKDGTDSSYCAAHHAVCTTETGKPWQALAGMMAATETTVVYVGEKYADNYAREGDSPLDVLVRNDGGKPSKADDSLFLAKHKRTHASGLFSN